MEVNTEALHIIEQLGDRRFEGILNGNIGDQLILMGDFHSARPRLEQAIELCQQGQCRAAEAAFMGSLGECIAREDPTEGRALLDEAAVILQDIGDALELEKVLTRRERLFPTKNTTPRR